MTTAALARLDQAELMQLALNAASIGDSGAAISYLKEAVSRPDAQAPAHYLLGAEYAQIKMYDRAIAEMEAAIALDPALSIARFQLGLLWLTTGNAINASEVLLPLEELGSSNALAHFGRGLMHLMRDEFADAVSCLNEGISLNSANPALNSDMQKIIDEVQKISWEGKSAEEKTDHGPHILISAYTRGENN